MAKIYDTMKYKWDISPERIEEYIEAYKASGAKGTVEFKNGVFYVARQGEDGPEYYAYDQFLFKALTKWHERGCPKKEFPEDDKRTRNRKQSRSAKNNKRKIRN